MKKLLMILAMGLAIPSTICLGAQTSKARLYCESLRFQRGRATDTSGFLWTLDMTTLNVGINGELAPDFFNSGYSNSTYVELTWELTGDIFPGALVVDIPDTGDANGNGFLDFFEVSQGVTALTSPGAYDITGYGNGGFTAYWSRDAGSSVGYCSYSIPNPFGGTLTFLHAFELLEYNGQLAYSPGATNVSGVLSLIETNSGNTLDGPVTFVKSATNRFNQLTLQSAFLTNASLQTLSLFTSTTFFRRTANPTNYFGDVEFNDGDPSTFDDDYYSWVLSIDDLNDTDHDLIPDFSDDPASALPRRPLLSLARGTNNNLWLQISGDAGRMHRVLETTSLAGGNWLTNLSLTLTNDPQSVSLPLPAGAVRFWRVTAE